MSPGPTGDNTQATLRQHLNNAYGLAVSAIFRLETLRTMNAVKPTKMWVRLGTGVLAAGGIAMSALGLTSATAQAAPHYAPTDHHHWCPGDHWDNGWGPYQNWNNCHDWDGPAGYNGGAPGYGPGPWQAPPPPPPFWAPWAHVEWNAQTGGWGFWNGPVWVPV